jgi:VIT1/CCC1 family predicted Fe2+/Mn2+ transporter
MAKVRKGWLRAAVMGANDGIVSTASLILGVAAAHATNLASKRCRRDVEG